MRPGRTTAALMLVALLCPALVGAADPPVPPALHHVPGLQAIPDVDLSGLERLGRDAILEARRQLAERQGDPAAVADAYARLAALYQRFDITNAADICWANARALHPEDYRWPYYQGWLALSTGRIDQALQGFQQAQRLNPGYLPLDLRMGQAWLAINQLEPATSALQRAAKQPGLRAAALYFLGQIAVLRRDFSYAEGVLVEALELDPAATAIHYPLAQAYRALGERDKARAHLARFKRQDPSADDPLVEQLQQVIKRSDEAFNKAMRFVRERDYPAALVEFGRGLAIDPDNNNARTSYARALYLAGREADAQAHLRQVQDKDPNQVLAAFLLALLMDEQQHPEQATELYRQVLALDPKHQGAHYFLAARLFRDGQYRKATEHYRSAAAGDMDLPAARLMAVVAAHHAGDSDQQSAQQLSALIAAYPQQAEFRYAMVRLRALSTDPQVVDLTEAVNLANQLAQAQATPANMQVLALAAAVTGQFEMAVGILEQVVAGMGWGFEASLLPGMERDLDAYRRSVMPDQALWPLDDPLLLPPPLELSAPFREYLTATPF